MMPRGKQQMSFVGRVRVLILQAGILTLLVSWSFSFVGPWPGAAEVVGIALMSVAVVALANMIWAYGAAWSRRKSKKRSVKRKAHPETQREGR